MPLPNLIVIGAMKCGTTSLHFQLRRHPEIETSSEKELNFFIEEKNWPKGVAWYASRFRGGTAIRGESSPNYASASRYPGVVERMASIVPDARLVYLVRDPIERLISDWLHEVAGEGDRRPFEEIARNEMRFLDRSRYWRQVSEFLARYPESRIHVIEMTDLRDRREGTLRRLLAFLDVDPDVPLPDLRLHRTEDKRRKTALGERVKRSVIGRGIDRLPQRLRWPANHRLYRYPPFARRIERPILSARGRAEIAERLRDDTNRFREFAGRDFPQWSV